MNEPACYLTVFLLSGFVGIGCKKILSANVKGEDEKKKLNNIPIASAISGLLLFSAVNILPDNGVREAQDEVLEEEGSQN